MPEPVPQFTSRLGSLDGLRGVAALIVVLHHLCLVNPAFSDLYLAPGFVPPTPFSALWWVAASPLQVFTAGQEAVLVFFVLSGVVLTLPVLANRSFDWMAYYPRRLVRLYLPVIASVILAAVLVLLHPQSAATATSSWSAIYSTPQLSWEMVVNGFDLLFGDVQLNNPTWSLRWEVLFSVLLPLYVVGAVLVRRRPVLAIVLAWVTTLLGAHLHNESIRILPIFFVGAVIASRLGDLQAWADRATKGWRWHAAWTAATLGALALVSLYWMLWAFVHNHATISQVLRSLVVPAAVVLVLSAALWAPVRMFLQTAPVRWLGRVSFSLYLVHAPIIIAVTNILGHQSVLLSDAISLVLALGAAELFARFVEGPSHRVSKGVGAWVSERFYQLNPRAPS